MCYDKITESDLLTATKNHALKKLRIVQTEHHTYRVIATLSKTFVSSGWKEGEVEVMKRDGEPKEWIDLNRLFKHIRQKYGKVPKVILAP